MSQYTSLGVTVSPAIADGFLEAIGSLDYGNPDQLARSEDGSVTAIWENRNHFDLYSSDTYRGVIGFLRGMPEDSYSFESITEGYEPDIGGTFGFNFSTKTVYEVYGKPFSLGKAVISKSGILRRRRS